jgi:glucosyl-3-phosphoglycerate synthase
MPPVLAPPTIRTFHYGEFAAAGLAAAKRARRETVHVVIPARDEEETIGEIVSTVRRDLVEAVDLVDELVVVDDRSTDATGALAAANGARVVEGPGIGKGEAMARGIAALTAKASAARERATPERIIVFLDGDVRGFGSGFVTGLLGPLLCEEGVDLAKARYRRPAGDRPTGGGRVTELVAKPALGLFFPDLAVFDQPLAGETAVRSSLLDDITLAGGYAVEVAMIIDTYLARGLSAMAEVDLGERRHRNRNLEALVPEAESVLRTIVDRARTRP